MGTCCDNCLKCWHGRVACRAVCCQVVHAEIHTAQSYAKWFCYMLGAATLPAHCSTELSAPRTSPLCQKLPTICKEAWRLPSMLITLLCLDKASARNSVSPASACVPFEQHTCHVQPSHGPYIAEQYFTVFNVLTMPQ